MILIASRFTCTVSTRTARMYSYFVGWLPRGTRDLWSGDSRVWESLLLGERLDLDWLGKLGSYMHEICISHGNSPKSSVSY
jgi:hypothetical protein